MVHQTADEAKQENIVKMGEPLGTLYSALWQEVATMHLYWLEYVELFGTSEDRVNLLNRAAPHFFRMVQDELLEASLLHLARITDPAFSMNRKDKPNLSIQALPELITDTKLKGDVQKAVKDALIATEFARDWRNRHIAHRDLNLALEQPTIPLADASRVKVNDALASLAAVLNVLANHYLNSETGFDLVALHDGAVNLLYVLDDGVRAQEERNKRIQEHRMLEGDLVPRNI